MKRSTTVALIACCLLGSFGSLTSALAQQAPRPENDYGTVSEEVLKQRLRLVGRTQITKTVKTANGYRVTTMENGVIRTLDIDGKMGHLTENGTRVNLPTVVRPTEPIR